MLAISIAWRFYRSRHYGALERFMAWASTAGICVGVCAMIVSLSAVNGFEHELRIRVFSLLPSATLTPAGHAFRQAGAMADILLQSARIQAVAQVVRGTGMLRGRQELTPVVVLGIDPLAQLQVMDLERFLSGNLADFAASSDAMIIGRGALQHSGLQLGDRLELLVATTAKTALLNSTASRIFTITGVIDAGSTIDRTLCLIRWERALEMFGLDGANALYLKTADPLTARSDVLEAARNLPEDAYLHSIMEQQGKNYHDIQLVRQVVYLAMLLIIAVSSFNIISKLIMAAEERHSEVAILRTMGASRLLIMQIFALHGLMLSLRGISLGLVLGVILSLNLTTLIKLIEDSLDVHVLNKNIYFIDFIPAQIRMADLIIVISCALVMSLAASLGPAFKASRMKIIEQLNG